MTKQLMLGAAAAALAFGLAACERKGGPVNEDPGTSNAAINATQDAASAAVGATSAATAGAMSTDAFVTNAAMGDMYEVEAGKFAQQRGSSAAVKEFGGMMVKEHTATTEALKAAVASGGVETTIPTGLDERRQGLIDNLRAASAADFDKVYGDQQRAAHEEALTLMQGYADRGDNAALKALAAKAAPKIQMHLDKAKTLPGA